MERQNKNEHEMDKKNLEWSFEGEETKSSILVYWPHIGETSDDDREFLPLP